MKKAMQIKNEERRMKRFVVSNLPFFIVHWFFPFHFSFPLRYIWTISVPDAMCANLRIKTTEYTEKHGVFDTNLVFSSVNSVSSVVKTYKVSAYGVRHHVR